jgi:DNA-directed RNA polymerase subunit K/omega
MVDTRERLVEKAIAQMDSRYLICSLVAKRAKQLVRHQDAPGVSWAINQALTELLQDRITYQMPALEKPVSRRSRSSRASA